jgi:hypothetical protein
LYASDSPTERVYERDAYRHRRSFLFRITLWTGTLLMGSAGHLGGTLVHGDDFFKW